MAVSDELEKINTGLKSKITTLASIILPILLGFGLTYYSYNSFSEMQLAQMKNYFVSANYNYVLISLFWAVLGYVLRAYRWKYTLMQIGIKPNFKLNFLAVSVGYFVNLSVPRSGEISRALILKKYQKTPFDRVFGTIIAERIVDFIILILFIAMALFIEFSKLKNFLLANIPIQKISVFLTISIILFLAGLYLYFFSKWKPILWLKTKVEGLKEGAFSIFKMPRKWPFLIYTFLIWFSYIMMFYSSTGTIAETDNLTIGTALVAFVIGSLIIAFTNGGFGFFPIIIAKILFLYGIPLVAGNAFGWIVWTSQLLITVVLGILAFLILPIFNKKPKK